MVRYQRGHREAFIELVRRHAPRLYNYVARNIGTLSAADEVACRVFMQVVHRAPEFRHDARFATWLYSIAQELITEELHTASFASPRGDKRGEPRGDKRGEPRGDKRGEPRGDKYAEPKGDSSSGASNDCDLSNGSASSLGAPASEKRAAVPPGADPDSPEESCVRAAIAPLRAQHGADSSLVPAAGHTTLETVMALPLEQRQVFLLREVADLPFSAIAQVIGTGEDDARSAMRLVLERLRGALSGTEAHARKLK